MKLLLKPGHLTLSDIQLALHHTTTLVLDKKCHAKIKASHQLVATLMQKNRVVYGINTGFGLLAHTKISHTQLHELQHRLILSHAAGTGEWLDDAVVHLILVLKINSLARGYSGIHPHTLQALIKLYNAHLYPCIPAKGSVGASGDLAPLAHLSAVLLGKGHVRYQNRIISAKTALKKIQLNPLQLGPKEGLALLNGTQVSTALALVGWLAAKNLFSVALMAGALSTDAARGSDIPFDKRIQDVRGHKGQKVVAQVLRHLLQHSTIRQSHVSCEKVQDPYSLRCQPQVMGACLDQLEANGRILCIEANAVSDNPLLFIESQTVLSGGNFHAEPIAIAADVLAIVIAEIGALSERRIALLTDPQFSGLPAFLTKEAGMNSGFMIAHVTAAALASENKSLAHPASVDSLPTSANQEDHVSMATYAARRLLTMTDNTATILAIELLAACQGIDFLRPLKTSPVLETIHRLIRKQVKFYNKDRYFSPDIEKIKTLIQSGTFNIFMPGILNG